MVERGARQCRELTLTRAMVRMYVGREHRFDAHAVAVRDFQVLSDLELRIDDRCAALAASTEDVGGAAGLGTKDLSKDHSDAPRIESTARAFQSVSRMRTATIAPEPSVSAATTAIAAS